jgi:hypothetical protein
MAFFVMLTTRASLNCKARQVIKATLGTELYGGRYKEQPLGRMGRQMQAAGQEYKERKPTLEEPSGRAD